MKSQPSANSATHSLPLRQIVPMVLISVVMVSILFLMAGTIRWTMAWVYLGLSLVLIGGTRVLLGMKSPELIRERAASLGKADAKPWDRVLMPLVAIVGPLLTLVVAGLDKRWNWPGEVPPALQWAGAVLYAAAILLGAWAMLSNRFFSGVVRIQGDRGHQVVTGGPYRMVRHPGYAASLVSSLAVPVMLGSMWALIAGILTVAALVVRTALEDRTLRAELPGYAAYALRTRFRLLPGIW